jgi:protein-disulfide isomerase/uncharacterized membrane protein
MTRIVAPSRFAHEDQDAVLSDEAPFAGPAVATTRLIIGVIVLTSCMFAALGLVLAQFEVVQLPGCGTASDCTRAAESRWGKLPGTEWPLSFLGFAYFQALVAAFICGGGRMPAWLRGIVVAGAGVSTVLIGVMLLEGYLCNYCLAVHALNIVFAIGYELSRRLIATNESATPERVSPSVGFSATFVATSLLLAIMQHQSMAVAARKAEVQLKQAIDQGTRGGSVADAVSGFRPGRYYLGPTTAKVHVVVVSDYQCPSCRTIDAQLRAMVAGRDDISISARHFPFCTDCNEHIDKTRHPNACRAALAAEAAGIVGGAGAFWRMHDWLFERGGNFTDDELQAKTAEIGLDLETFLAAFTSEQTLAFVRGDAADADAAGLRFTPMVFINGKPLEIGQ